MRFFSSKKKQNRFLELLAHQAEYTVQGLEALAQYMKQPDDALAKRVANIEKEADEVRRIPVSYTHLTLPTKRIV